MFNNNNNQSNGNEISVNTGIETFWGELSSLNVGCYNDKISLRWLPAIGKDDRGHTRYNSEGRVSTCISHVKVSALLSQYDKKLKEMVESGEEPPANGASVMVPINAKSGPAGLFIEYKKDENGKASVYLTMAKQLTEAGADPANIIRYKFNDLVVMSDMNPEQGGGEQEEIMAEFDYFVNILRAQILMTGINSHASRYSASFGKGKSGFGAGNQGPSMGSEGFSPMLPPGVDELSVFS